MAMTVKRLGVTPCSVKVCGRYGRTYCLPLQGRKYISYILNMETSFSSETLLRIYQTARYDNPENYYFHSHSATSTELEQDVNIFIGEPKPTNLAI
jgi:hypothetical protein